jgi:hypothetical protein
MASWEDFSRILAEAKESKKLDPVGQEDDDVNNDGKVDDTDSYLKKRRESVGAAISADRKKKSMVKISVPEKKLGYKVADIGPDGKEHNVKTHGNYKEALDPVGQEDDDIDNDGKKNTKSDKYLLNRRKVRSKVIEGASTKVDMGGPKVGCDDPDPRSMKTASNLVKTKLRLMGLRPLVMSNEPEGNQLQEKPGDGYLGPTPIPNPIRLAQDTVDATNRTSQKKVDTVNNLLNRNAASMPKTTYFNKGPSAASQKYLNLKNSYQPEGEIVEGKKKDSSYLETDMKKRRENNEKSIEDMKKTKGYSDMVKSARKAMGVDEEFVGEDKEYRREMAKAAARERAEEKRSDNEWRKTKPGEKKSLKLSTTPITDRTAKSYVDKELGQIKYMDKVTKKNKNVVGLVTNEEKGMSSDEMSGILKGHKYSKLQLLDMSKKSTKEGRHGEAAAFYKEFDRDDKKEELSLVDVMIAQFSPLNEAPENTIPGGKRRRGLSKTIQSRQVDKLADEGDYERADKLQDVSSVKLKKKSKSVTAPEEKPTSPTQATKKSSAGKTTAYERATRTSAAGRIRAARIARQTEREKREYKEKVRQETKAEKCWESYRIGNI